MIFPREYKVVGNASSKPCGDKVYFLSRYLIRDLVNGFELLEVEPDPNGKGLMRDILDSRVLAGPEDVSVYQEKVQLHDRAKLVQLACESGKRCTIFTGIDEHMTFVLDPDPREFITIHVYDVIPPRPTLSAAIRDLEETGIFGEFDVMFSHNLRDISQVEADVYPCRASGFTKTLDADLMLGGETVAGCMTASQLFNECYGKRFELRDICPLNIVSEEPFIARCCRKEREGIGLHNGKFGAVVHWGASPQRVFSAVIELLGEWRERLEDRGC
jgi:hypothetical protein